jgi:hypothetical protein
VGSYNPHAPIILGQEWVPILDKDTTFTPTVNTVEVGHAFDLLSTRTITQARVYIHDIPPTIDLGQNVAVAIYPAGTEDQSGPVRSVIIPANAIVLTGGSVSGGTDALTAISTPADDGIAFSPTAGAVQGMRLSFAVTQYAQALQGKRILDVRFLYAGEVTRTDTTIGLIAITPDTGLGPIWTDGLNLSRFLADTDQEIFAADLGELNYWWNGAPTSNAEYMPWQVGQLQRFDAVAQKLYLNIVCGNSVGGSATVDDSLYVQYIAMQVLFCDEKRIAYGDLRLGQPFTGALQLSGRRAIYGANTMTMRDMNAYGSSPAVPAGRYVATVSSPNNGGSNFSSLIGFPGLNAVQQLYEIAPHPGVQVNIPFPLPDRIGETFTSEATDILPQISLHIAAGTLTEPHAYGRQAAAQVWGLNTATQEIYDDISGVAASYPQVRYYARRFGDTTIPLTLTGTGTLTGSTASITVATFDSLIEILDGWKEVTLRFAVAPSMGAVTGTPGWTWSATGETVGNRWEILAASAPALSGTPGNYYNLAPAPNTLGAATYQPPSGATVELTWMPQGVASVFVTGASADAATDAFLIFSQDPPTVTGMSLTARTQAVSGYALDCGALPCCIPTGIAYSQIQWSAQTALHVDTDILDTFERTVASGWGTADTGQAWSTSGGAAADYNVAAGVGAVALPDTASTRNTFLGSGLFDNEIYAELTVPQLATGAVYEVALLGRQTFGSATYYTLLADMATSGAVNVFIERNLAGVFTTLATTAAAATYTAGARLGFRFRMIGSTILGRIWNITTTAEPSTWTVSATDTGIASGGAGTRHARSGSNTNVGLVVSWDNFTVTDLTPAGFGAYELQRFDAEQTDFQTIMLATDSALTSFNDYEARVGITSVYRIRALNALNFAGAWSGQVSGAPPSPGVTGGCANTTGALIFTSNADQTGLNNAAYVMQWEGTPTEDFSLPEADMVTYQPMYGRDGSVAFHGTERGLESFDRTVLLHAAAISPVRLADAQTIRDLAWANLPYVCVRDDIGDRWFASVRIPAVNARMDRTKYMAGIKIVETTQTPYPVDP